MAGKGCWVFVVLLLMACGGGVPDGRRATPTAGPATEATAVTPPPVAPLLERAVVEVESGDPPNVYVRLAGSLAAPCLTLRPDLAETTQIDRTLVMIVPTAAALECGDNTQKFEARIRVPLSSPAPGIYQLNVNGVTVTFELDAVDFAPPAPGE